MDHPVLQAIHTRRSVRKYQQEQISDQLLDAVLEAGRYAPSGGNNQTTHFIVIQNHEVLRYLRDLVEREFANMPLTDDLYSSLKSSIRQSQAGGYEFYYQAPTLIVVANKRAYGNAMADSACALQNMMIAAHALGLGACWINQLHWLTDHPAIAEALGEIGLLPDETVCGGLSLGYSAQPDLQPLKRHGNPVTYVR